MLNQLPKRANSLIDNDFINFMEREESLIDFNDLMENTHVEAQDFR